MRVLDLRLFDLDLDFDDFKQGAELDSFFSPHGQRSLLGLLSMQMWIYKKKSQKVD